MCECIYRDWPKGLGVKIPPAQNEVPWFHVILGMEKLVDIYIGSNH